MDGCTVQPCRASMNHECSFPHVNDSVVVNPPSAQPQISVSKHIPENLFPVLLIAQLLLHYRGAVFKHQTTSYGWDIRWCMSDVCISLSHVKSFKFTCFSSSRTSVSLSEASVWHIKRYLKANFVQFNLLTPMLMESRVEFIQFTEHFCSLKAKQSCSNQRSWLLCFKHKKVLLQHSALRGKLQNATSFTVLLHVSVSIHKIKQEDRKQPLKTVFAYLLHSAFIFSLHHFDLV